MSVTSSAPDQRAAHAPGRHVWTDDALAAAVARAYASIAPTWPLDRFIAVNPFWGLVADPLATVAARLRSLAGAELLPARSFFRAAHRNGSLRDSHLQAALAAAASPGSVAGLRALLEEDAPVVPRRARVADVVDETRDLGHQPSWRDFVTQSMSQFCASYFDEGQATFGADRDGGLYASWRRYALRDRSPALLMGAAAFRTLARDLPANAPDTIAFAIAALGVPESAREDYLWSLLLDLNGWASWCAYRRWTARLEGGDDDAIVELLAIRLAWEWLLYRLGGEAVARRWVCAMAAWPRIDEAAATVRADDWLLQAALEEAWREPVLRDLPAGFGVPRPAAPAVQAVFCIDVRSEVFRRAFEATSPAVQTLGFAGFFGLPIEYQPLGSQAARPQLPGLLAPRLRAGDTGLSAAEGARRAERLALASAGWSLKSDALSTFTFVEALGIGHAADLVKASLGRMMPRASERAGWSRESDARRKPRLVETVSGEPLGVEERCELAHGMLRAMSLTRGFAPLVLLVGHGSTTVNNPHAAGLECGACCGQTGEVNARAAAALLNDAAVRAGLRRHGIAIPERTRFVAALHDTTTDEVALFDLELTAPSHAAELERLRSWLAEAGGRARAERAPGLGIAGPPAATLGRALAARALDWAQVRPEWGLAGNAAFIVAPREHCRHLDLRGRAFLHEYRHEEDESGAVLEQIMTAPMVVAHWINFQYYASTVDNLRYGSGNKVLHNVVGGRVGVFEGNSGDLRIGLPLQSVHDGTRWVHTPLRLSVFIEAPRPAIDAVLAKHETVRDLVRNGWLSLYQLDAPERAVYARHGAAWRRHHDS